MSQHTGLQTSGETLPYQMPRGFPVHYERTGESAKDADLREAVIRQIEDQQHAIEMQIAMIERGQVADEANEAIELLKGQLRSLDGQKVMASSAPIAMLGNIARSIPATFSAIWIAFALLMRRSSWLGSWKYSWTTPLLEIGEPIGLPQNKVFWAPWYQTD